MTGSPVTSQPDRGSAPAGHTLGPDVTLRPMTRADLPAVLRLEHDLFGDEAWTEGMLAAELDGLASGRHYLVAEDRAGVAGYAGLLTPGGGQADVLTLAVAEHRWGQRIGATLLDALLAEAARRGCRDVFLEVRVDNHRAQRLYQRRGFTEIGIRRGYYQPSGTDAVVMRMTLPRPPAKPGIGAPGEGSQMRSLTAASASPPSPPHAPGPAPRGPGGPQRCPGDQPPGARTARPGRPPAREADR